MVKIHSWTFAPAPASHQADLSNCSVRPTCGAQFAGASMLAAVAKHSHRHYVAAKCRDVRLTLQKIDSIGNLRLCLSSLPLRGPDAARFIRRRHTVKLIPIGYVHDFIILVINISQ